MLIQLHLTILIRCNLFEIKLRSALILLHRMKLFSKKVQALYLLTEKGAVSCRVVWTFQTTRVTFSLCLQLRDVESGEL